MCARPKPWQLFFFKCKLGIASFARNYAWPLLFFFFLCLISALFFYRIDYLARCTALKFPSFSTDKSIFREAKTEKSFSIN